MRLLSVLVAILSLTGLSISDAKATYRCGLEVSPGFVLVGQWYSFQVWINFVDFGPPAAPSSKPFEVIFHGTRDGRPDTFGGEHLLNIAGNYREEIGGYNEGGYGGLYMRYAEIRRNGVPVCITNSVYVELQDEFPQRRVR